MKLWKRLIQGKGVQCTNGSSESVQVNPKMESIAKNIKQNNIPDPAKTEFITENWKPDVAKLSSSLLWNKIKVEKFLKHHKINFFTTLALAKLLLLYKKY